MKPLLKIILIIGGIFLSTFVLLKATGVLTIDQIEHWLTQAKTLAPVYVGGVVAVLLFADLFIAVPTLTIIILSGYFLGHSYGALAALIGVIMAGSCGYLISRYFGEQMLSFLIKERDKREEAVSTFQQHGFTLILLSRAMPILPEVTACLSGMTRMPYLKFMLAWLISSVPYILIASYAGSISSVDNPQPAILTAIGISTLLWAAWLLFQRKQRKLG